MGPFYTRIQLLIEYMIDFGQLRQIAGATLILLN